MYTTSNNDRIIYTFTFKYSQLRFGGDIGVYECRTQLYQRLFFVMYYTFLNTTIAHTFARGYDSPPPRVTRIFLICYPWLKILFLEKYIVFIRILHASLICTTHNQLCITLQNTPRTIQ